ncbi:hypothetical protein [Ligilactobacillus saerimneri]|uniref:hypothetical protein n=1 Tax=Ligilactobacillus saerimneri TaxID=228229 RepID=UPI0024B0BF72|nr:hypothetical protein [Ligilactobacillus saerimneri]MDI9205857.1 hypothetical protein [Ligilactobacillus saerimneri]
MEHIKNHQLAWLEFELLVEDELEIVIGGKTCYLGPAFNNESYKDKEGWVLYPYDLSYEMYIPYTDPKKILSFKIGSKTIGEHFMSEKHDM